jgi:hypothetical protein
MTTYVLYQGRLIEKRYCPAPAAHHARSELAAPALRNFEAFASPVDDRLIRSNHEREIDLQNSGSYDPRDTPATFRKIRDARYEQRRRTVPTEP